MKLRILDKTNVGTRYSCLYKRTKLHLISRMKTNKQLAIIFCLLGAGFSGTGQIVNYKCYIKTDCTNSISPFKEYILSKNGKFYHPDQTFICSLPDTGSYTFTLTSEANVFISVGEIKVSSYSVANKIDTFNTNDLTQFLVFHSTNSKANKYDNWQYCGKTANGFIVDSTNAGRSEGTFKNGRAIGAIKTYNRRGELIFIEYYNKKGKSLRNERLPAFYKSDNR